MPLARLTLIGSLAFGLSACAPESDGDSRPSRPFSGFELASVAGADTASASQVAEPKVIGLSVEELGIFIESGHVRLIDIRTAEEVAAGMIQGAEHIPLDRFDPAKLGSRNLNEVVLYCRSGRRSEIAAKELAAFTGEPAKHLSGGIIEWEAAGMEIVRR